MLGDRAHGRIVTKARRVVFQLLVQVARVQAGESRDGVAVPAAVQTMAGEAGVISPAVATAHRHHLAVPAERRIGDRRAPAATGKRQHRQEKEGVAHLSATPASLAGSGNCQAADGLA